MPSVYVRCFSSPLPEWRRARHVLDHCRAIHAVLTADVTPVLPEAAVRPELLPIYDVAGRRQAGRESAREPLDNVGDGRCQRQTPVTMEASPIRYAYRQIVSSVK